MSPWVQLVQLYLGRGQSVRHNYRDRPRRIGWTMVPLLLDHLVGGGQQRFGDGEAEGFGGLEIDH
jgi:hypothetical protein